MPQWRACCAALLLLASAVTSVAAVQPAAFNITRILGNGDTQPLSSVADEKAAVLAAMVDIEGATDEYFRAMEERRVALKAAGMQLPLALSVLEDGGGMSRYRRSFQRNLREIARLNRLSGDDLAYGITSLTHLSKKEYERMYMLGRRRKPKNAPKDDNYCSGLRFWDSSGMAGNPLVADIDWRTSQPPRVTPVKDQGNCGSCVVFANMAAVEAAYIKKYAAEGVTGDAAQLSEQDFMDCMQGSQCWGAYGYEVIDRAVCYNVTLTANLPYTAQDEDACASALPRRPAGIAWWTFVPPNAEGIRRALYHGVVSAGINGNGAFQHYKRGVIKCGGSAMKPINHEIAIVGYSDQHPVAGTKTAQVFTAKNSWGTSWGEAGFFKLQADCKPRSLGARTMYADEFIAMPITE